MLLEGVILGVLALNEFVFLKSLHGSNYQLGFLFQFSMIVFLFLIVINEFLKRIKNRQKFLRFVGITTRLPLVLIFLFPENSKEVVNNNIYHYIFLALFLLYFLGNIFIYPNINYLLKNNYRHSNFGKLYSYATSLNKIVMLITTFVYGYILDLNNFIFIYVFPLVAVLGVFSLYILSSIPVPEEDNKHFKIGIWEGVKNSIKEMKTIITENIPYKHFEIGFMFYGFSFMISVTIITIYFYDTLNLNYSSVAFYKNSYNILAIILLPFFGKLLGDIDPRKFAAFTFGSVGLYIMSVLLTQWFTGYFEFLSITLYYTLAFYIIFHGIFAATMPLLWNIGSAYFCKPEEAGTYQSLHLSLTGLRAVMAPILGVFFYEKLGFTVTFIISILFSMGAVALMVWSWKKDKHLDTIIK
jgi:predicted MFS family arabinose efflux permease